MLLAEKLTPRDYQEESITKVLNEPTRAALIADGVGLGKTLTTTEIILRAEWRRVLLIGIKHTFDQWDERLMAQSDGKVGVRWVNSTEEGLKNYEALLRGDAGIFSATIHWLMDKDFEPMPKVDLDQPRREDGTYPPKFKMKNGELVLKPLPKGQEIGPLNAVRDMGMKHLGTFRNMVNRKAGGLDAIIFDESHLVSNRKSRGRVTLVSMSRGANPPFKIALSATWTGNSFENAWSTVNWLWPDLYPAYWPWHDQWVKMEPVLDEYGKPVYRAGAKQVMKAVGEKEPAGSFVKTLPCYIRNESDMKAPPIQRIFIKPTAEQQQQYDELSADMLAWLQTWDKDYAPLVVDIPAVLRIRHRQVSNAVLSFDESGDVTHDLNAPSAKLGALRSILDYWGDQPALIYTDSVPFARIVAARMTAAGYKAEIWNGSTSAKERKRIKADFMEGRLKYLVGNPKAMGTGLDGLQKVCSKLAWLSLPDGDPTTIEQGEGRIFRSGMTEQHGAGEQVLLEIEGWVDAAVFVNANWKRLSVQGSISAEALAR